MSIIIAVTKINETFKKKKVFSFTLHLYEKHNVRIPHKICQNILNTLWWLAAVYIIKILTINKIISDMDQN